MSVESAEELGQQTTDNIAKIHDGNAEMPVTEPYDSKQIEQCTSDNTSSNGICTKITRTHIIMICLILFVTGIGCIIGGISKSRSACNVSYFYNTYYYYSYFLNYCETCAGSRCNIFYSDCRSLGCYCIVANSLYACVPSQYGGVTALYIIGSICTLLGVLVIVWSYRNNRCQRIDNSDMNTPLIMKQKLDDISADDAIKAAKTGYKICKFLDKCFGCHYCDCCPNDSNQNEAF